MKALNLYTLTRVRETGEFSRLAQALSGRNWHKAFSVHEVSSLCAMVDGLVPQFTDPGMEEDWIRYFDGFYFSYTIEHISKEFDLLKLSADGDCVLNIELKSEEIGEDRIRRQLEQNRYYLSHIARTILSFTYVMETDRLYCLNDHGYLRACDTAELAQALRRPVLQQFVETEIGRWFRAQDYLISPVGNPEKLLTGRYFLTNQQAEFRKQILEILREPDRAEAAGTANAADSKDGEGVSEKADSAYGESALKKADSAYGESALKKADSADGEGALKKVDSAYHGGVLEKADFADAPAEKGSRERRTPVISLTGSAGTGKTLLLFDLAIELSKKKKVLFLHGGPLREGHRVIDRRLHKVTILSGTEPPAFMPGGEDMYDTYDGQFLSESFISGFSFLLVDEANRFSSQVLEHLLRQSAGFGIPCVFSYDPHTILGQIPPMEDAEAVIARHETMRLELSGNIRINRPIFSFLRTLFHRKDRAGHVNYSCIDVLYAGDRREEAFLTSHYLAQGYVLLQTSGQSGALRTDDLISQEYDKVLIVLDQRFYYDDSLHLCADGAKGAATAPLYEGLSRARERLCLLVVGNPLLFSQILEIRES